MFKKILLFSLSLIVLNSYASGKVVLITGFDPFDKEAINPSIEAVKKLPDTIAGAKIIKLEIPTVFGKSKDVVEKAIKEYKPDYIINVGQAGGRDGLTVERVAINVDDARIQDNDGNQPIDKKIQLSGKSAYFTQLPIKKIVADLNQSGIKSSVSNSAGTFVCNHIMYQVQYLIDKKYPKLKAGFVHVPFIPQQIKGKNEGAPSMELAEISKGLEKLIQSIVSYGDKPDIEKPYGAIK